MIQLLIILTPFLTMFIGFFISEKNRGNKLGYVRMSILSCTSAPLLFIPIAGVFISIGVSSALIYYFSDIDDFNDCINKSIIASLLATLSLYGVYPYAKKESEKQQKEKIEFIKKVLDDFNTIEEKQP